MRNGYLALALVVCGCGSSDDVSPGPAGVGTGGAIAQPDAAKGGAAGLDAAAGGAAGLDAAAGGGGNGGGAAGVDGSAAGGAPVTDGAADAPHVVGNCGALAAVGQWEDVTPPYIVAHPTYTGALVALVNPQNPAIVYVTSDSDGVFKSTDCGSTWTKTNTGRNAAQLDSGRIWAAVMDTTQPDTLYAITGYGAGGLWKTTNGGMDWDQMLPSGSEVATTAGGFVERVVIDPTNHLHILINFHLNCGSPHTPVCFGESTDGGASWKILDFPSSLESGWGEGSGMMLLTSDVWIYEQWDLFYSSDHGANWTKVTPTGSGNVVPCFNGNTSTPPQTPDNAYYLGSQAGILRSTNAGATWSVVPSSGSWLCPVIGDGTSLYAATSASPEKVYTATYADPMKWSVLATPGLPSAPAEFAYTFGYDPDHHVLYTTIQSAGLWRVVLR